MHICVCEYIVHKKHLALFHIFRACPGTFIPLFSLFIFYAHEFRTRWITVTGWKREEGKEEKEEAEREADEERPGEKGENKGKKSGRGSRVGRPLSFFLLGTPRHILTPGFSLILAPYRFILSLLSNRKGKTTNLSSCNALDQLFLFRSFCLRCKSLINRSPVVSLDIINTSWQTIFNNTKKCPAIRINSAVNSYQRCCEKLKYEN